MKISKRLESIASLVDDNTSFIDVGCDHGLLSIYLVKNKKIIKAIASDINKEPLKKAQENIIRYNLENKIITKLENGINNIDSDIDTIIISGMGGILISDIIKKGDLKNIKNIVLSPNNDTELVRRTIVSLGFKINNELFIKDKGKYYNIISFVKGKEKYNKKQYKYGPYLIRNKSVIYIEYLKSIISKNISILNELPKKYIIKRIRIKKEIREINKIL